MCPLFTVFTATYNRAYVLRRAFESLQKQTFKDFEWVVVDDGSTDDTKELVQELAQEASFSIRYFYQTHGHKKKAINYGVREAKGALFVFLDSDDELVSNALERFDFYWKTISTKKQLQFCAIFGLCRYSEGDIMGKKFPHDIMESDLGEIIFRYKSTGERSVAFVTSILKKYPFPEDVFGLVPEGMIWMKIARMHQALFVNECFRIYYTSGDSITPKNRFGYFIKERSEGRALYASEMLNYEIRKYFFCNPIIFCAEAIMYGRSVLHIEKKTFPRIHFWGGSLLVFILFPVAYLMYILDKICMIQQG